MKWLTMKQVCAMVGYSRAHIDRLEKAGLFPARIKPGGVPNAKVFYVEQQIIECMKRHVAHRS